jgi:hypothetical protein
VAQDGAGASSFDEKMRQHQAVEFGVEMTRKRNTSKMIRGVDCDLALEVFKKVVRGGWGGGQQQRRAAAEGGTSWGKGDWEEMTRRILRSTFQLSCATPVKHF